MGDKYIIDVTIQEVYTDPKLINKVVQSTTLSTKEVSNMFRYNMMTVSQVARLTNLSVYSIFNRIKSGTFTQCKPFQSFLNKRDPVFVLRNDKLMEFIESTL